MGFYSFYKIIKDLFRTFFGSKNMKIILALIIAFMLVSYIMPVFATSEVLYLINHSSETLDIGTLVDSGVYYFMYITKISRTYTFQIVRCDKPFTFENASSPSQYNAGSFKASQNCNFSIASGETSYGSLSGYINNTTLSSTATIGQNLATFSPFSYTGANSISYNDVVYSCNFDIKDENGNVKFGNTTFNSPHFDNTDTVIQNLQFEYLYIDPADFGTDEPLYFHLLGVIDSVVTGNDTIFYYNDISYRLDKKSKYFFDSEPTDYYSIPRYELPLSLNSVYFFVISSDGSKINQSTNAITTDYDGVYQVVSVNTTGILTQDDINNNNIKSITESSKDTLNEITDSHIDNDFAESLPTNNIQDITTSGIDTIFTTIYNAFTSGTAQDIVFPIPFTDKSITLSATYVSDFLLEYCSWVYALIQAFWGYLIGRFIVTDVMKKMTAIKSGNFDKIQNNNIKGEML